MGERYSGRAPATILASRAVTFRPRLAVETHGPLGTLWVGLGLCAFYIALIWLNTLLGVFLTPLFLIPGTWLMDKLGIGTKKTARDVRPAPDA